MVKMMNSYYGDYQKKYLHDNPPPRGIRIDVKEFESYPGTVFLVAYASDMAAVPESRVHEFADWINATLKHLNSPLLIGQYAFHLEKT